MTDHLVPQAVQDIADDINKNLLLTNCELIPYFAQCSEGPDEWLFMLSHATNGEICRHLRPNKVDWHTLYILLDAMNRHGLAQFKAGKAAAVNSIAQHFKTLVGG